MTMWQNEVWTSDKLLDALRERSGGGRSIKFNGGENDDVFKDAIYSRYGDWDTALRAAGLHPKTRLINYWTESEVIKRIREIAERGESINTLHLEQKHPRLWNAARRLFGNIHNAIEAAGYDYSGVKKRGAWTRDSIVDKIRDYFLSGVDISQISMIDADSKLLAAGQKLFGSWSKAVNAAGIDYAGVKARRRDKKRRAKSQASETGQQVAFPVQMGKTAINF